MGLIKNKITIEASHIYFGGGYILLEDILIYLSDQRFSCDVYVINKKIYDSLIKTPRLNINVIRTNLIMTLARYFKKRESIIYFVNLPPFRKNSKSILYFHNELILNNTQKYKLKNLIYRKWLKKFSNNVDNIACQTLNVKIKLENIGVKKPKLLPFFNPSINHKNLNPQKKNKKFDFCCISSGEEHKNLGTLFDAVHYVAKFQKISLATTLENKNSNKNLIRKIIKINKNLGYQAIQNFGLLERKEVISLYNKSTSLVMPSLKESLGLPLIEANLCGTIVISSNRPFSHEILNNPITFDPLDSKDLAEKLVAHKKGEFSNINQTLKIENKISEIIKLVI